MTRKKKKETSEAIRKLKELRDKISVQMQELFESVEQLIVQMGQMQELFESMELLIVKMAVIAQSHLEKEPL